MNCGQCQQPLKADAQFCGNCGTPVLRAQPVAPMLAAQPAVVAPNPVGGQAPVSPIPAQFAQTAKISNYRVLSVVVLLLFCLPLGAIALVYSNKVDTAAKTGDTVEAQKASRTTKILNIIGIVIGALAIFSYVA